MSPSAARRNGARLHDRACARPPCSRRGRRSEASDHGSAADDHRLQLACTSTSVPWPVACRRSRAAAPPAERRHSGQELRGVARQRKRRLPLIAADGRPATHRRKREIVRLRTLRAAPPIQTVRSTAQRHPVMPTAALPRSRAGHGASVVTITSALCDLLRQRVLRHRPATTSCSRSRRRAAANRSGPGSPPRNGGSPAQRVTSIGLQHSHIGAEVAEHPRAVGPGQAGRQIEHPHAVQCAGHRLPGRHAGTAAVADWFRLGRGQQSLRDPVASLHGVDHGVHPVRLRRAQRPASLVGFRYQLLVQRRPLLDIVDRGQLVARAEPDSGLEVHPSELSRGPGDGE